MSLAGMSVRRLVGMAVNRRPVLVDGQPAGVPVAAWLTTKWDRLHGASPIAALTWQAHHRIDFDEDGAELVAGLLQDALTLLELRDGS